MVKTSYVGVWNCTKLKLEPVEILYIGKDWQASKRRLCLQKSSLELKVDLERLPGFSSISNPCNQSRDY
jgi:hypothetical protein